MPFSCQCIASHVPRKQCQCKLGYLSSCLALVKPFWTSLIYFGMAGDVPMIAHGREAKHNFVAIVVESCKSSFKGFYWIWGRHGLPAFTDHISDLTISSQIYGLRDYENSRGDTIVSKTLTLEVSNGFLSPQEVWEVEDCKHQSPCGIFKVTAPILQFLLSKYPRQG